MMRSNRMNGGRTGRAVPAPAMWLAYAMLMGAAVTADAQMTGNLRFLRGYDLSPNPPLSNAPTTLTLYGVFPTGCGVVDESSVVEPGRISLRLRSTTPCDSAGAWSSAFSLGILAAGQHTVTIVMTMDRPDSGTAVYQGQLDFAVVDSIESPPPPPPPPVSIPPLLGTVTTDPWPPTPNAPVALIVAGFTPFDCPRVSAASVIDTSHLSLTLSAGSTCSDTTRSWAHRFELGLQREGYHVMDLAITLDGDSVATHHLPVRFLVVNDTTGWGPRPDSLDNALSRSRPNPFVTESRFSVSLEDGTDVDISVYDIRGRRVSTVYRGRLASGTTEMAWNGRRDDGARAAAGVYFYRLSMRGRVMSRRLLLLRP